MYEAYAAMLVGVVSAAAAIAAMVFSRRLAPLAYTTVHLAAILLMIMLVTFGYETIPLFARMTPVYVSRLIYLGVSSVIFVNTMLIHTFLNRSKGAALADLFSIER
jgi:hypothetical protein